MEQNLKVSNRDGMKQVRFRVLIEILRLLQLLIPNLSFLTLNKNIYKLSNLHLNSLDRRRKLKTEKLSLLRPITLAGAILLLQ